MLQLTLAHPTLPSHVPLPLTIDVTHCNANAGKRCGSASTAVYYVATGYTEALWFDTGELRKWMSSKGGGGCECD